jgi:hypothetical protein
VTSLFHAGVFVNHGGRFTPDYVLSSNQITQDQGSRRQGGFNTAIFEPGIRDLLQAHRLLAGYGRASQGSMPTTSLYPRNSRESRPKMDKGHPWVICNGLLSPVLLSNTKESGDTHWESRHRGMLFPTNGPRSLLFGNVDEWIPSPLTRTEFLTGKGWCI